ncbi:MAG: hypothetical protein JWN80_1243 [Microbacteriaceae bacterium]|nr:hypothetical protein [Microbacteriaceae bacterium]
MAKFFGTPDGIHVGQQFIDRAELSKLNVHRPTQGGIHGNRSEGADSIVLSGGYSGDADEGDYIIYTGHGGQNANTRRQERDQSVDDPGNAGLITSKVLGLPVRVIRGANLKSPFSPPSGYVYGGLFEVSDVWTEIDSNGYRLIKFKLERLPEQAELVSATRPITDPAFATSTVTRRIRDTSVSRKVKEMYGNHCQICGTVVPGIGERLYSEGAHVRPLGRPHLGDDALENLLCLCPNHHTELDIGGMVILDDYSLARTADLARFADLSFRADHQLHPSNATYQRELWIKLES